MSGAKGRERCARSRRGLARLFQSTPPPRSCDKPEPRVISRPGARCGNCVRLRRRFDDAIGRAPPPCSSNT
jgi:hypothetical protein